jgi:hypothetical protein
MNEHRLKSDVVVVGGGMAGVCAALVAARNGATVVLVQDRSVLGGNASSEVRMHICGADESGHRRGWRESGIIEEIRLDDAVHNPHRAAALFDLLLYDKVTREPRITLLLDTACCGVEMQGRDRIGAALARSDSTETTFRIEAPIFCDCSGDGRLGAEAGAEFRVGREARSEFGESLALDQADRKTLGSSIMFTARKHDRPMPFVAPPWARPFTEEALRLRGHRETEYGYWWLEWGGQLDTITDSRAIRQELLRIVMGVWDHIKNSGKHDAATWALEWVGMLPGKRESRRFVGEHTLRQQDLEQATPFDDRVTYGGWSIDLHPPDGVDSAGLPACTQIHVKEPYSIPLRSLYSKNVNNLFFAGRNISATHVAFGSTRVMATCAVMGQAVGTAAALAALGRTLPRETVRDPAAMRHLQQTLLRDDQTILGCRNEDEADLARSARVTASTEQAGHAAANVINGVARTIGEQSNQWRSQAMHGPEHIDLAWDGPRRIGRVHLTFDTGFARCLTLTHLDAYSSRMIRGPQPETIRDYEIQVRDGGSWRTVARVSDNIQRRRVHPVEPVQTDGLRIVVTRTNGVPFARLFEVRAYA